MHPIVGRIVGGSFFLMLCFAALTSTISMLEVPTAYLVDQKKLPRKTVVWSLAAGIFILGMPSMLSQGIKGFEFLNKLSFLPGKGFPDIHFRYGRYGPYHWWLPDVCIY